MLSDDRLLDDREVICDELFRGHWFIDAVLKAQGFIWCNSAMSTVDGALRLASIDQVEVGTYEVDYRH